MALLVLLMFVQTGYAQLVPPFNLGRAPTDGATNVRLGAALQWGNPTADAVAYEVLIYSLDDGGGPVVYTRVPRAGGVGETTTLSLAGFNIKAAHNYEWRVRSVAEDESTSAWTAYWSFQTGSQVPNWITTSILPTPGSTVAIRPTFSWAFLPQGAPPIGSNIFAIQIAKGPDFSEIVFSSPSLTGNSFVLPEENALEYGETYAWRVRYAGTSGDGPWSNVGFFVTEVPKVSLASPANGDPDVYRRVVLEWEPSEAEVIYTVQISEDPEFDGIVFEKDYQTEGADLGDTLSYSTTYFWRVICVTQDDLVCDPSDTWNFTVEDPVQIAPEDGATVPLRPTFRWREDADADQYQLMVAPVEVSFYDFATTYIIDTDQTEVTLPGEFPPGRSYNWELIRLVDGEFQYSTIRTFTTVEDVGGQPPGQVVLVSPADDSTDVPIDPAFTWRSVSNTIAYDIEIEDMEFGGLMVYQNTETDTTHTLSSFELRYGVEYRWRVIARNQFGYGPASAWNTLTTVALPSIKLEAPADQSEDVDLSPEFRWTSFEGVTHYRLVLATNQALTQDVVEFANIATQPEFTSFQYPALLDSETEYYWRVEAQSPANIANPSAIWGFVTGEDTDPPLQVPGEITLHSPDHQAENVPLRPTLRWHSDPLAEQYRVLISRSFDFSSNWEEIVVSAADTSYTLTADQETETEYYWVVQGVNEAGVGTPSPIWMYTTQGPPAPVIPGSVDLVSPEANAQEVGRSPEFSWHPAERAVRYSFQISLSQDFASTFFAVSNLTDTSYVFPSELSYNTRYFWRVRGENDEGSGVWSAGHAFTVRAVPISIDDDDVLPTEFSLAQNYPNPFNPSTELSYSVDVSGPVRLAVYDVMGREVAVLVDAALSAGRYTVSFDAKNLPSGVYLARLTMGRQLAVVKMTLLK